jgi:hypothetical protein
MIGARVGGVVLTLGWGPVPGVPGPGVPGGSGFGGPRGGSPGGPGGVPGRADLGGDPFFGDPPYRLIGGGGQNYTEKYIS